MKKLHLEESEMVQLSEEELEVLDRETVEVSLPHHCHMFIMCHHSV